MSQCLTGGIQGFPLSVTGFSTAYANNSMTVTPSDISLSLSGISQLWNRSGSFLSGNDSSTFHIGGGNFTLKSICLAPARQTGLSINSGAIGEFQLWGNSGSECACIIIPLFVNSGGSTAGNTITNMYSAKTAILADCVPSGSRVNVVRYATCLEYSNANAGDLKITGTVTVQIAYWSLGVYITSAQQSILTPLVSSSYGIPMTVLMLPTQVFLISSFTLNALGNKGNLTVKYSNDGTICIPYPTISMSITTNGISIIKGLLTNVKNQLDTDNYKCIAINRTKDIINGQLVIDPRTGQRLSDVADDANQQDSEVSVEATISPGDIGKWIGIILGTILGTVLIAYFVMWLQERVGQKVAPDLGTLKAAALDAASAVAAAEKAAADAAADLAAKAVAAATVTTAAVTTPLPKVRSLSEPAQAALHAAYDVVKKRATPENILSTKLEKVHAAIDEADKVVGYKTPEELWLWSQDPNQRTWLEWLMGSPAALGKSVKAVATAAASAASTTGSAIKSAASTTGSAIKSAAKATAKAAKAATTIPSSENMALGQPPI